MATFKIIEDGGDYINCEVSLDSGEVVVIPVYGNIRKTIEDISDHLDKMTAPKEPPLTKEVTDAIKDKQSFPVAKKPEPKEEIDTIIKGQ